MTRLWSCFHQSTDAYKTQTHTCKPLLAKSIESSIFFLTELTSCDYSFFPHPIIFPSPVKPFIVYFYIFIHSKFFSGQAANTTRKTQSAVSYKQAIVFPYSNIFGIILHKRSPEVNKTGLELWIQFCVRDPGYFPDLVWGFCLHRQRACKFTRRQEAGEGQKTYGGWFPFFFFWLSLVHT